MIASYAVLRPRILPFRGEVSACQESGLCGNGVVDAQGRHKVVLSSGCVVAEALAAAEGRGGEGGDDHCAPGSLRGLGDGIPNIGLRAGETFRGMPQQLDRGHMLLNVYAATADTIVDGGQSILLRGTNQIISWIDLLLRKLKCTHLIFPKLVLYDSNSGDGGKGGGIFDDFDAKT